ncbi:hypothetical protein [Allohahella marinimesophila]|uniref:Transmembrane anchor protein n=1 Tax=Allohahella marinimesophila TaxID=1054972 RepID=A0ABP7NX48_9GAMM
MYNTEIPAKNELPSSAKLIRSTIIAAIVAAVLLVTVVMPAEYGLDPTGAGRVLGLKEMGEIKEQLAHEAEADEAALATSMSSSSEETVTEPTAAPAAEIAAAPAETAPDSSEPAAAAGPEAEAEAPAPVAEAKWEDEVRFVLTPGEGTEYKLTMEKDAVARYSWETEGGPLNFDTHGDGSGQSISYEKGRGVSADEGELTASFTGNHGWFFRNRNDNDVTVVLRTDGDYGELKKAM